MDFETNDFNRTSLTLYVACKEEFSNMMVRCIRNGNETVNLVILIATEDTTQNMKENNMSSASAVKGFAIQCLILSSMVLIINDP